MGIDLTKDLKNYESLIQAQGKAMKKMLSGFEKHVIELDLSHNDLGKYVYSLKIGLQGLHKVFTFLNLSGNSLGQQSEVGLAEALSVLVRSESYLAVDLRNNNLFKGKTIRQHEELLRGLWPFLYKQFCNFNNNGNIILNVGKQLAYLNEINELPLDVKRLIASKFVRVSCGAQYQFNSSSFFKAKPKEKLVKSQSLDMLMT
ncbi:hypothetical protein [Legionella sp. PC997]|uniref:hypothetical protein n=1 Tax=Legionella sp. PC997 TaxID=2755562 RepID=UPI0015FC792B|nr:hypothetical protein [Legionella sp. PC997]